MDEIRVKVTAYEGNIIIETLKPDEDDHFAPVGGTRFGSVLMDTKNILGMSKEAVELLKTIPRGTDCIGDVSTWKTTNGNCCFSWFGHLNRIVSIKDCVSDRDGIINVEHVTIENEPPKEAIEALQKNNPQYTF